MTFVFINGFFQKKIVSCFLQNVFFRSEHHPEGRHVTLDHYDVVLNDGEWHNVHLMIGATNMSLTVDKITVSTTVTRPIRTGEKIF